MSEIAPARGSAIAMRSPQVSYLVARLERAVRREIERLVSPQGLSVAQYTTLSILGSRSGLSNAQLARRLWVTPQSMNEVIAVLERMELIERVPDAGNRRILRTALTARGRDVLAVCDAEIRAMEQEMLADLGAAEQEQLVAALDGCVRRLGAASVARRANEVA